MSDKPTGIPIQRGNPKSLDKFDDRRERFIERMRGGEKRTSAEVRDIMGMKNSINVTSFLRTLKFRFVIDGDPWRLNVGTGQGNKLVWWLVEKKTLDSGVDEKEA